MSHAPIRAAARVSRWRMMRLDFRAQFLFPGFSIGNSRLFAGVRLGG